MKYYVTMREGGTNELRYSLNVTSNNNIRENKNVFKFKKSNPEKRYVYFYIIYFLSEMRISILNVMYYYYYFQFSEQS